MTIVNLLEFLETEIVFLTQEGFYPNKKVGILNRINAIFITTLNLLEWILMLLFLFLVKAELIDISETLLFSTTQTAFMFKLFNFIIKKDVLLLVEKHLRKPTLCDVTTEERQVIADNINGFRLVGIIFRGAAVFATIFYALFPLLDSGSAGTKRLPLRLWIPFEMEKSYYFIWFLTTVAIGSEAFTNSNFDILTIKFVMMAVGQFENLKKKFRESVPAGEKEVDDAVVLRNLKACVIHYNDINSYIMDVERTFSNGIFIQFCCSVLIICMTGFQLMVIPVTSIQFATLNAYFVTIICQIVMYCWYGQKLMESSDEITDACYSAEWYKCSARVQKMYFIIMERAKLPVRLRAGNFFVLDIPFFMAVLRSSYSYFAVLRRVYSDKLSMK